MKGLRNRFDRFCFQHRNKGIPNLMLWIILANAVVYVVQLVDPSDALFYALRFDRDLILQGQVWRLFSFVFLELYSRSPLWVVIAGIFYYQLGRAVENYWGSCKFTLYYLTGILFLDIAGFLFNYYVLPSSLHLTLFLAYATMYPDATFLIFFIIPVKARWLGIVDLALYLIQLLQIQYFPINLVPLFALANYILYFGKDFFNIFPMSWRINADRVRRKTKGGKKAKPIPFPGAGSYTAQTARPQAPYTHRCTVCGRTDVTNPELEFRYCSKCKGYYCYCIDHINNHTHIQ